MHQVLVTLLHKRPDMLTAMLASSAEPNVPPNVLPDVPPDVPPHTRVRPGTTTFTNLSPPSYHADLALRVEDASGRLQELIIGEVQLKCDRSKHISWPVYLTAARAEVGLDCPVTLVVVAPKPSVARWCARPIALDRHGSVVQPVVLEPKDVPRIVDVEIAKAHLEMAVLSALMHAGSEKGVEIATAALMACGTLDREYASQYADMVHARLDPEARRKVKELMGIQGYRYQMPHARQQFAAGKKEGRKEGRKEGHEKGLEQGLEQGLEKGLEQGLEQGREKGLREVLTSQLEHRFGPLPAYATRAIAAADVDTLRDLAMRVLAAASLDDLVPRPARSRSRVSAAGTRPRSRAGSKAETRTRSRSR